MSRVNERWGIERGASFYSLPEAALRYLAANTTPLEERIVHRIVAAWRWSERGFRPISMTLIAEETGSTRRSVRRALEALAERGLIDFVEGSAGRRPELSILPLVRRVAASNLSREDTG